MRGQRTQTLSSIKDYLLEKTIVDPSTGCWLYQGSKNSHGYCSATLNYRREAVHRISAHIHWGYSFDSPMWILHKPICPNRHCWNPEHLYEGDALNNAQDTISLGNRHRLNRTHCPHGHEYTSENTIISSKGVKVCRTCKRQRDRNSYIGHTDDK